MQHLTKADLAAIEREFCQRSLANFAKRAWHVLEPSAELKWGWVLDAICEHLEAVTDGRIKRLLINVPPGTMKSLLVGVIWPAWEWGPKELPHMRFVGTAHEEQLAIRDSRRCRSLIKSEWFQLHWPVALLADLDGKREFGNDQKGIRQARAFTSMTGVRGDRVILDDPISADNANSEAKLEAARIAFTETLPTRINSDKSAIVVIMQRLNERDTSGVILEQGLPYTHLRVPMRFEADNRCTTGIGWTDPRIEDGELMFSERFDEAAVSELEKTLREYATAGQLQQRPAPREGGMFKRAWFNVVKAAPVGTKWVRGWDLAASTKSASDYTAGVKIGKQPDGRFIIGHVARDRLAAGAVRTLIKNTASQDGRECMVSIPQDPGQAGKDQAQSIVRDLAGYNARSSTESGDKATRADPLAAQAEAGNVDVLQGEWNEAFFDELCLFPNGAFDDQVDGASRAFNELAKRSTMTSTELGL